LVKSADDLKRILGSNVRALRESRQWSRKQLASALGVTVPSVHRLESGEQFATAEVLVNLADILKIPVARLLVSVDEVLAGELEQLEDDDKQMVLTLARYLAHRDRNS
jgi:transcriptional regulator with XRE-family HTH domain